MIAPGVELIIPPANGVYYKWKDGDTIQAVADRFYANANDILEAPLNDLDLTDPKVKPDSYIMIPGGKREAVQWFQGQIPRGSAGTLSKFLGEGGCDTSAGGAVGDGSFGWPLSGAVLIGNDYIAGVHQGIDLGSTSSSTIVAADSGVVVYAGWSNGGYGNLVVVDHGNGFQTVYAHMSGIAVACGQSVGQGAGLGGSGHNWKFHRPPPSLRDQIYGFERQSTQLSAIDYLTTRIENWKTENISVFFFYSASANNSTRSICGPMLYNQIVKGMD